jgi:hypothetical protein
MHKESLLLLAGAVVSGMIGGAGVEWFLAGDCAIAQQKPRAVNAEEFVLVDANGKARAGLGLGADGEVGFVLTSRDGQKTLYLSPDEPMALKLVEKSGRVLWGAP